jgi:hypothetical protein
MTNLGTCFALLRNRSNNDRLDRTFWSTERHPILTQEFECFPTAKASR